MRHKLPIAVTVHIHPQVAGMLDGVWIPTHPYDIAVGSRHDGRIAKDAYRVLFDLKKIKRELPLRDIRSSIISFSVLMSAAIRASMRRCSRAAMAFSAT